MKTSSLPLKKGATGKDVIELQIRLAGFRGTLWDGIFGPVTERQLVTFQREFMKATRPSGVLNKSTWDALQQFAAEFPIEFEPLMCPCGRCPGFGNGVNEGVFYSEKPKVELFYKYEYPGIHKAILNAYRATQFYAQKQGHERPTISSGYRCSIDNELHDRDTTNHMGKALDIVFPLKPGEGKREDCERCDRVRGLLVAKSNFQIRWGANNRKALEPSSTAPSWVHMDVRCYEMKYLDKSYFVKSSEAVDKFD